MSNNGNEIKEIEGMTEEITEEQKKIVADAASVMANLASYLSDAASSAGNSLIDLFAGSPMKETIQNLADWLKQLYAKQISDLSNKELICLIGSHSGVDPEKEINVIREETVTYMKQNALNSLTVEEFFRNKDDETSVYQTVMQRVRRRLDMPEREGSDNKKSSIFATSTLTTPATFGMSNDKAISRMIGSTPCDIKESDVITGKNQWWWGVNEGGKNEKPVALYISQAYMDAPVKTSQFITIEDMAVFDALCTIIFRLREEGKEPPYYITPEEIWRKENGIVGNKKTPSPKQKQEIRSHMDKMRFTRLWLNLSDEIIMHGLSINDDRIVRGTVDTYFITANYVQVTGESNHVYDAYKILEMPFLYTYCMSKDYGILYFDYDLLDTKTENSRARDKDYVTGFKRYLMQQIKLMYVGKRQNFVILYSTIYADARIPSPEERAKNVSEAARKDREKISEILDAWVEKKWISGHVKVKKKNTFVGERIIPNDKNFVKNQERKKE